MIKSHVSLVFLWWCSLSLTTGTQASSSAPIIETQQGQVKGAVVVSTNGHRCYAYRGIPYAKAPVGVRRFKRPQPADPWTGVFNAEKDPVTCPQLDNNKFKGDEDCLKLTVYTRSVASTNSSKLPVLIFIHGGTFITGSASPKDVDPLRILNQDFVFVVPQYRLGALGFLSVGDKAASGNYGFYDQLLAMQWVKTNIAAFGGDPEKVTLSGFSAGAISAGLHLVSKLSIGYYRAMIMQSGPSVQAMQLQKEPLKYAMQLGDELKCNANNNTPTLMKCLNSKTAKEIVEATNKIQGYDEPKVPIPFAAVIEADDDGKGVFLSDIPQKLFDAGKYNNVPVLLGNVLNEASHFFVKSVMNYLTYLPFITKGMFCFALSNIAPYYVELITKYENNIMDIINAADALYMKGVNIHDKKLLFQTLINVISDITFKASTDAITRSLVAHGTPVYLYSFEYLGDQGDNFLLGAKQIDHGDDNLYLLHNTQSKQDEHISNLLGLHWRNFVHNKNPTMSNSVPVWIPVPNPPPKDLPYLKYGTNATTMENGFFTAQMALWNVKVPKIVNGLKL